MSLELESMKQEIITVQSQLSLAEQVLFIVSHEASTINSQKENNYDFLGAWEEIQPNHSLYQHENDDKQKKWASQRTQITTP